MNNGMKRKLRSLPLVFFIKIKKTTLPTPSFLYKNKENLSSIILRMMSKNYGLNDKEEERGEVENRKRKRFFFSFLFIFI